MKLGQKTGWARGEVMLVPPISRMLFPDRLIRDVSGSTMRRSWHAAETEAGMDSQVSRRVSKAGLMVLGDVVDRVADDFAWGS